MGRGVNPGSGSSGGGLAPRRRAPRRLASGYGTPFASRASSEGLGPKPTLTGPSASARIDRRARAPVESIAVTLTWDTFSPTNKYSAKPLAVRGRLVGSPKSSWSSTAASHEKVFASAIHLVAGPRVSMSMTKALPGLASAYHGSRARASSADGAARNVTPASTARPAKRGRTLTSRSPTKSAAVRGAKSTAAEPPVAAWSRRRPVDVAALVVLPSRTTPRSSQARRVSSEMGPPVIKRHTTEPGSTGGIAPGEQQLVGTG